MPKLSELYPSKYLSAADLDNKEAVTEITEVTIEEFENDGQKRQKPLCHFKGSSKGLVLNKTNAITIAEIADSDDTADWPGTRVCLYSTMVNFGSKMTEAIRIRKPGQDAAQPVAPKTVAEELNDSLPPFAAG